MNTEKIEKAKKNVNKLIDTSILLRLNDKLQICNLSIPITAIVTILLFFSKNLIIYSILPIIILTFLLGIQILILWCQNLLKKYLKDINKT